MSESKTRRSEEVIKELKKEGGGEVAGPSNPKKRRSGGEFNAQPTEAGTERGPSRQA
jgi:hypothetical protein